MSAPVVSVVIPSCNRPALLAKALRSALDQTFRDIEVIVVDDASEEDLKSVVEAASDPRIRYERCAERSGGPSAMNRGARLARGEWVAFLDDDDEWLPARLERQIARMQGSDASVGYCLVIENKKIHQRTRLPVEWLGEGDVLDQILRGRKTQTSTFMIRRSALEEVGGVDEKLVSAYDIDLLLRLAVKGHRFAAVNEVLVVWNEHGHRQITHDPHRKFRGFRVLVKRWEPVYRSRLGDLPFLRWKLMRHLQIEWLFLDAFQRDVAARKPVSAFWNWIHLTGMRLYALPTRAEIFVRKRFGDIRRKESRPEPASGTQVPPPGA